MYQSPSRALACVVLMSNEPAASAPGGPTGEAAGTASPRSPSWRWLPPVFMFLAARALLLAAAAIGGHDPWGAKIWSHWDSNHYLTIAQKGYTLIECARTGYARTGWCGNTGWLPGYPLLVGSLAAWGMTPVQVGGLLAALFHLATLTLLWRAFLAGRATDEALMVLALAAFFPGAVWQHAVFPVSMFVFFALAALAFARSDRFLTAGACAAVAAFTYSTGFLLAPVGGLWALMRRGPSRRRRLFDALALGLPCALGFGAVLWVQEASTGAWDAFFRVQAKYGHGLHTPWATVVDAAERAGRQPYDVRHAFSMLQMLSVGAGIVLILGAATARVVRGRSDDPRRDLAMIAYTLAYWLFPLVMGQGVSLYRADALLLPAVVLTIALPGTVRGLLLSLSVALTFHTGHLFFENLLP